MCHCIIRMWLNAYIVICKNEWFLLLVIFMLSEFQQGLNGNSSFKRISFSGLKLILLLRCSCLIGAMWSKTLQFVCSIGHFFLFSYVTAERCFLPNARYVSEVQTIGGKSPININDHHVCRNNSSVYKT